MGLRAIAPLSQTPSVQSLPSGMSRTGITLLSPGQREISPSGPPRGAGEESADHERPRYHRRRRRCPRNVPPRQVRPGDKKMEEHTSELQSLMRISYAVFCLKKKKIN